MYKIYKSAELLKSLAWIIIMLKGGTESTMKMYKNIDCVARDVIGMAENMVQAMADSRCIKRKIKDIWKHWIDFMEEALQNDIQVEVMSIDLFHKKDQKTGDFPGIQNKEA